MPEEKIRHLNHKIVEVHWIDTVASDLKKLDEIKDCKSESVYTIGYLLEDKENEITIASEEIDNWAEFRHVHTIPRGCIKETRVVRCQKKNARTD